MEIQGVEISEEIFTDEDSDYGGYYDKFDTILWLPSSDIVKQTPNHQNITGMVLSVRDIDIAYEVLSEYVDFFGGEKFPGSFKKVPDEIKRNIVGAIKTLGENGFFLSVSIPAYLFDHCEDGKKVKSVNYAITNSLLQKVFREKHKVNIKCVDVHIVNQGSANSGLKSRVSKLARKLLSADVQTDYYFFNSSKCERDQTLDRFFGLCCWFVNQKHSMNNSYWLELIKN